MGLKFLDDLDDVFTRWRDDVRRAVDEAGLVIQRYLDDHDEPTFQALRRYNPIVSTKAIAIVTRNADVREVLARDDVFSVELYAEKMERLSGSFLLGEDSGRHDEDHAALMAAVEAQDFHRVGMLASETAEAVLEKHSGGSVDIVSGYADPIVERVSAAYLGTAGPDPVTRMQWARQMFEEIFINARNDPDMARRADAAAAEMVGHLDRLIQQRKAAPGTGARDLLGRLVHLQDGDGPTLDDRAIRNNLFGLTVGWLPPTTKAFTLALDELLGRPAELARAQRAAREDDDVMVGSHLFEALRFKPQNSGLLRRCTRDTVIAEGTDRAEKIHAGAVVYAATQSAMMDETAVEDPQRFDAGRSDDTYLHFGLGLHRCFGEPFNRHQLPAMAKPVLRLPGLRRSAPLQWDGLFPASLPVEFDQ